MSAAKAETKGNQVRAAQLLGINRNTLRKKLKEHGFRQQPVRRGAAHHCSSRTSGTYSRGSGPVYRLMGRMSLLFARCSMM